MVHALAEQLGHEVLVLGVRGTAANGGHLDVMFLVESADRLGYLRAIHLWHVVVQEYQRV